jgi:hypothetical protein
MSRYGLNYYELASYGSDEYSLYVTPSFIARSENYGYINLSWTSPVGDWSKIKLTRNTYGFPTNPWDGTELDIKGDGTYVAFKETDPTVFDDNVNLGQNTFYYYSLFVFDNINNNWVRAGNASAISALDYGYSDLMYQYLPEIYKVTSMNDPVSDYYNEDLYSFLSLFGFQLSLDHTYTNLLVTRYDTQKVGGSLIPAFMQQFGLSHEPEIGYQQERILLQNIALIYKEKGSLNGLKEFIKSYSGYGIPSSSTAPNPPTNGVVVGHNLMLDYNDSSFEESVGHWVTPNASATLKCLKEKSITQLELTSNVASLTIGAHEYQVGQKIYISGCSYGLFNKTASPVTITAVTSTKVSFSLTGTDIPITNAYNNILEVYPIVYPYPKAWVEPTSLLLYPNKRKGILAVKNANSGSGTVKVSCGYDNPIIKGIPVTAGLAYSFSTYAAGDSSARNVTAGIDWYDRFGVYISSNAGSATSDSTGQFSVRVAAANKTAPTGAYYAVPTLSIASSAGSASNEWHYFDAAQFEQSATVTEFDEARQIHVTLKANRINELVNPNFYGTTSAAPWAPTGATQTIINSEAEPGALIYNVNYLTLASGIATLETVVTNEFVATDVVYVKGVSGITDGSYTVTDWGASTPTASSYIKFNTGGSTTAARTAVTGGISKSSDTLKLTATGTSVVVNSWDGSTTSQQMGIYYPDTNYTFSVYTKSGGTGDTATLSINWYDSSNSLISTNTGSPTTITAALVGNSWNRPEVTAVAPSTAAYATVTVTVATTNGTVIYLDAALFENQSFVFPFFSGNGGPGRASAFKWEGGVANGSRSHYYKNYATLSNRLANGAFTNQLLLGTTIALYFSQPKT